MKRGFEEEEMIILTHFDTVVVQFLIFFRSFHHRPFIEMDIGSILILIGLY